MCPGELEAVLDSVADGRAGEGAHLHRQLVQALVLFQPSFPTHFAIPAKYISTRTYEYQDIRRFGGGERKKGWGGVTGEDRAT